MRNRWTFAIAASATVLGCAEGGNGAPTQRPAVSECGGFLDRDAGTKGLLGDPATYCEEERLLWTWDEATGVLNLANNRILLNCCGEHSITVAVEGDGTYVVSERDAPEFLDARCGCMCVWDFTVEVDGVAPGSIDLRLVRHVTDSEEGPSTVWEGSIDLSAGAGSITVSTASAEPWCSGAIE